MTDKYWRLIENKWNLTHAPWSGAIGIEEVDDTVRVPSIVCWFTRGWDKSLVKQVVALHNAKCDLDRATGRTSLRGGGKEEG